jgi:hypothetical protein
MPRVGLIASQNGLGHARRLAHFSAGLHDLGYEVFLYLSTTQIQTLMEEIRTISPKTIVRDIKLHGLDGPTFQIDQVVEIPEELELELKKLDFVISDNVTWPGRALDSFILMGHFSWIDYWEADCSDKVRPLIQQALGETLQISNWFLPKDFSHVPEEMKRIKTVEIPLSRYGSDGDSIRRRTRTEVWYSKGTTGLNWIHLNGLEKKLRQYGLETKTRETHRLRDSELPALVLGRPGLGTIRDCLAWGVPFLPCWVGEDPELSRNQNTMKSIGLIPSAWEGNQQPNLEILRDFSNDEKIQDRIKEYWFENSAPIVRILSLMGF